MLGLRRLDLQQYVWGSAGEVGQLLLLVTGWWTLMLGLSRLDLQTLCIRISRWSWTVAIQGKGYFNLNLWKTTSLSWHLGRIPDTVTFIILLFTNEITPWILLKSSAWRDTLDWVSQLRNNYKVSSTSDIHVDASPNKLRESYSSLSSSIKLN